MRKTLTLLILVLVGMTAISLWFTKDPAPMGSGAPDIGGAFTLTDYNGHTVSDGNFHGKLMLVTFGFTHCPDVCPIAVGTLAKTLENLGQDSSRVVSIFITVDPARDTPEVLKNFLGNVDQRIVGLTGTIEQITEVAAAYKTFFSIPSREPELKNPLEDLQKNKPLPGAVVPNNAAEEDDTTEDPDEDEHHDHAAMIKSQENYIVDHSAFIYLMDTQGKYLAHFSYNASPEDIAATIRKYVAAN